MPKELPFLAGWGSFGGEGGLPPLMSAVADGGTPTGGGEADALTASSATLPRPESRPAVGEEALRPA